MQINTSISQNVSSVKNRGNNVEKLGQQPQVISRIEAEKTSSQQNKQQRFDVDALSLITQDQQSAEIELSGNAQTSNSYSGNNNKGGYDQPSQLNKSAVAAYESIDNHSKREDIQQVFGVDLFA